MGNTQSQTFKKLNKDGDQELTEKFSGSIDRVTSNFYEQEKDGNIELDELTRICPGLSLVVWQPSEGGDYFISIYYEHRGLMKCIRRFQSILQLRNKWFVSFLRFPIVRMIFELDSDDDKDERFEIEVAFDFSDCFDLLSQFGDELKSDPFPLPQGLKMRLLDDSNPEGPYFYYYILGDGSYSNWDFYIVLSSNIRSHRSSGFDAEKLFGKGDRVCLTHSVCSKQIPFIARNAEDKLVIMSQDDDFVPIEIELPNQELTTIPEIKPPTEDLTMIPGFEVPDEELTSMPDFGLALQLWEEEEQMCMPGVELPDEEMCIPVFGLPEEEKCMKHFGFSDEEDQICMPIGLPDEKEMTMTDFLAQQEIEFSKRPSIADVSRSALVFAKEDSFGSLASCEFDEMEDSLFEL